MSVNQQGVRIAWYGLLTELKAKLANSRPCNEKEFTWRRLENRPAENQQQR